jgi:micrococcal nuclease
MKLIAGILFVLIALLGTAAAEPNSAELQAYEVVRVIDGDTVVLMVEGREVTVRLIGLDTPETVHPQKPVEVYGKQASRFTRNLLRGESVYVVHEAGKPERDKYRRLLAYLYRAPDGLFVNAEIIRQGYGHAYTKYPFKHMDLFWGYERAAREAGKGLWTLKTEPTVEELIARMEGYLAVLAACGAENPTGG